MEFHSEIAGRRGCPRDGRSDLPFGHRTGRQRTVDVLSLRCTLQSACGAVAKLAKLEPKPFHSLRHGYATMQMEVGSPAPVVQRLLGHTRVSTTLDIYSHVTKRLQKENVSRFGQLFSSRSKTALASALASTDPAVSQNMHAANRCS